MSMMNQMKKGLWIGLAALAFTAAGCASDLDPIDQNPYTPTDQNPLPTAPDEAVGQDEANTFDHMQALDYEDPFSILERLAKEGPPQYSAKLHSCPKMRYQTFGRILTSRGVNVANATVLSAGQIFRTSEASLGGPNYAARSSELTESTTTTAVKMFDIWVAAAPEIIANMPNAPGCLVAGAAGSGPQFFDAADNCTADGISCLIGYPATQAHIDVCSRLVKDATTLAKGKLIAVAALAAATHTCE